MHSMMLFNNTQRPPRGNQLIHTIHCNLHQKELFSYQTFFFTMIPEVTWGQANSFRLNTWETHYRGVWGLVLQNWMTCDHQQSPRRGVSYWN